MKSLADEFDRIIRSDPNNSWRRLAKAPSDEDESSRLVHFLDTSGPFMKSKGMPGVLESMPDIHFDFIDDLSLNAVAFVVGNQGYIGTCRGAILLVYDLFYRLLSHPDVFTEIGNASEESVRPFHSEGAYRNYSVLTSKRTPEDRRVGAVLPNDPTRVAYANWLAMTALDFLRLHEFAHIRHGHCEYWVNKTRRPFIAELEANSGLSADQALTLQTLEMDADAYATATSIGRLISYDKTRDLRLLATGPIDAWLPKTLFEALTSWQYAVQNLFWMFGLGFSVNEIQSRGHPVPPHRFLMVTATADEMLRVNATQELRMHFHAQQSEILGGMVRNFRSISDGTMDPNLLTTYEAYGTGVFGEQTRRILDHWKVIRQELLKFSHVRDLAL